MLMSFVVVGVVASQAMRRIVASIGAGAWRVWNTDAPRNLPTRLCRRLSDIVFPDASRSLSTLTTSPTFISARTPATALEHV